MLTQVRAIYMSETLCIVTWWHIISALLTFSPWITLHNILAGIELRTFLTRVSNFYCGKCTVIGKTIYIHVAVN